MMVSAHRVKAAQRVALISVGGGGGAGTAHAAEWGGGVPAGSGRLPSTAAALEDQARGSRSVTAPNTDRER